MTTLARSCGWCGSACLDPMISHCASCGGPLPLPRAQEGALIELGPPPPPAPRALPAAFRREVLVFKNVYVIIGGIFVFVFFWTVLFALIGAPLLYLGWTRGQKRLLALSNGATVQGRITDVDRDTSVRINGRSPWRISFEYPSPGGRAEGWVYAWKRPELQPDDPTWVVFLPEDPSSACLWPPVR